MHILNYINSRARTSLDRIKSNQKQVKSVKIQLSKQTDISMGYYSNYYTHALKHNSNLWKKGKKKNYLYQ